MMRGIQTPRQKRLIRDHTPSRYHPYQHDQVSPCEGRERQATTAGNVHRGDPSVSARATQGRIKQEEDGDTSVLRAPEGRGELRGPVESNRAALEGPSTQNMRTRAATRPTREVAKLNVEIEALKGRIQELERSGRRLKSQMALRGELLKDTRGERDEARTECLKAEEALEERERYLEALTREADRYRGWWLTDYYSLKVVLGLVPNKKDVEAISAAAHSRFATYSAGLKQQQ